MTKFLTLGKKKIPVLDNKELTAKILDLEKRVATLEQLVKLCPKAKAKAKRKRGSH